MSASMGALIPHLLPIAALTLRWPPDVFWQATPTEFAGALRPLLDAQQADRPLTGAQLQSLLSELD